MAHDLADTSLIIDLINRQEGRRELLQQLLKPDLRFYSGMRPGEEEITARWLDLLVYHDVTREIAERAGALRYQWGRKGKTLSLADATIAAAALHHGLTLLTDNEKHFPMPELARYPLP